MPIEQQIFGEYEGEDILLFTLSNQSGMSVKIMTYGATITSITLPESDGKSREMSCGFDQFESYFAQDYLDNAPYFGGTVGRYCSQIKDSRFSLYEKTYLLAQNAGENNLHGGVLGFDKKVWQPSPFQQDHAAGVEMRLHSKDMEEGFPGNVDIRVRFSLLDTEDTLEIEYEAIPDQDTPLTMTNHTYFNLSGFATDNQGHELKIQASRKLQMDASGAATGVVLSLDGAVDDLREAKQIGEVHQAMATGFEHYYLFDKEGFDFAKVAEIKDPESGLSLEVSTSEPGMLFYSGMYTSDKLKRENGLAYGKYRAFCCETHRYPNGPNIPGSPGTITQAGQTFISKTSFAFRRSARS